MDVDIRGPLVDLFRRGEASSDVRLLPARGGLGAPALSAFLARPDVAESVREYFAIGGAGCAGAGLEQARLVRGDQRSEAERV